MEFNYKEFKIASFYAAQAGVFYGEIKNCEQLITFQASTFKDLKNDIIKAIDELINKA